MIPKASYLATLLTTKIPNVRLVPLEDCWDDAFAVMRMWRNEARQWFVDSDLVTEDEHREWGRLYLEADDYVLWIIHHDSVPCGTLSFSKVTLTTAEMGHTLLIPQRQRQGIMAACVLAVLAHAWAANLYDVTLDVLPHNNAAIKLYERCGFKRTGFTKTNSGSVARMACVIRP